MAHEQEFIITRGIPASGKTTYAKQWVIQDPVNRVRINRDDIREELFGKNYQQNNDDEQRVTQIEHSRIQKALKNGKSVISDNTHLNPRFLKPYYQFAKQRGIQLKNVDFPLPLDEAIRRNSLRDRVVPEHVIRKMYSNLGPNGEFHHFDGSYTPKPFAKPANREHAVIFDMDGTLTNISSIRHFVAGKYRNFDMFHRSSLFCPPNAEVLQMAYDAEKAGLKVIIVTARSEPYREVTELWLNKYGVNFENMYMRPADDYRQDALVKQDILDRILVDYDVVHAVDDRPEVIKVWNKAGILATKVPGLEPGEVPEGEEPHIVNLFRSGGCLRCGKPLKSGAAIGPRCAQRQGLPLR